MYGAIIGDLAGSIYEYEQSKKISRINNITDLIVGTSFYSDDTILTIAIADAILHNGNYEEYLREYGKKYLDYRPDTEKYFEKPFSPGFIKWINKKSLGKSKGNGAMMRIAPVGYMFSSIDVVNKNTVLATIPSHNSIDALNNSRIITNIIFLARKGLSKEEIINTLGLDLKYVPFKSFNYTCSDTIDNCLYALFYSNTFEEAVRTVISYGGDTDTNACIVGSMAEALYGLDESLKEKVDKKIPEEFVKVLKKAYQYK